MPGKLQQRIFFFLDIKSEQKAWMSASIPGCFITVGHNKVRPLPPQLAKDQLCKDFQTMKT